MASSGPFPNPQNKFNSYINSVIPYLDINKTRLKVPAAKANKLKTLLDDWNITYPRHINRAKRTAVVTQNKNDLRKEITTLLRQVYRDIPASVLTNHDRSTLKLKARKKKNATRPAINDRPGLSLDVSGGAIIKVTTRRSGDEDRTSRHKHSDAIELCYKIGGDGPASPGECTNTIIYTRAIHTLRLNAANAGQRFRCYVRWKNIRDDNKSGPWSRQATAVITD